MSFDLSQLSTYTEQKQNDLIRKSLLTAKTISTVNKLYGVKYKETINIMDGGTITFQGDGCSYTPTGSTAFTQVTATAAAIKIQESLCPTTLDQYYLQKYLNAGSADDTFNFEAQWIEMKAEQIAAKLETDVWQANISTSGSLFDGFEKQIQSLASVSGSTRVNSGSAFNASSSIGIVSAIYNAINPTVLSQDDLVVFMGVDALRTYQTGIVNLNLFNYAGSAVANPTVLGTNIPIVAVNGLNSTSHIYAGRKSNFYFVTDLLSDFEQFDIWYSKDNREVRTDISLKAGTAIAFPSEIAFYQG